MKILIVDDEVIITRALKRAFESRGHEVYISHSGEEGLDLWIELAPHAVLLDVVMPGLTGPQVIEEHRNRSSEKNTSHIVLMTAHSGIKEREAALALGAHDFIQKPFEDVFALVKRIENY